MSRAFLVLPFALLLNACDAPSPTDADGELDTVAISSDSGKADAYDYQLLFSKSKNLAAGKRSTLTFQINDAWGDPVTAFDLDHTKLFHLIVVSEDLSYFKHIHPTDKGNGKFSVQWTPPEFDQSYHLYAQIHPTGESETLTYRIPLAVPGLVMKTPIPLTADTGNSIEKGDNVLVLDRPIGGFKKGNRQVAFMVHDASTGEMAEDLEPFLGARAHLVVVKANVGGKVFEHAHDMGAAMPGMGGHADHGGGSTTAAFDSSGALSFDVRFPSAGIYRLWAQFRRADKDATLPFTIEVK